MKHISVVAPFFALVACATSPPPPAPLVATAEPCPEVPASAPTTAHAPATSPTPATKATSAYHGLQGAETAAVNAPGATAAYIREVRHADDLARVALRLLVSQDGHPTDVAVASARQSIDDLVRTLEATPGSGAMP